VLVVANDLEKYEQDASLSFGSADQAHGLGNRFQHLKRNNQNSECNCNKLYRQSTRSLELRLVSFHAFKDVFGSAFLPAFKS
jgi:hypothetical protein